MESKSSFDIEALRLMQMRRRSKTGARIATVFQKLFRDF